MASDISIIIPVFNRPDELRELLQSLSAQTDKGFEVIVVEDGSTERSDSTILQFVESLDIQYFYKENSGPGLSRNYGCGKAKNDFFVFLDSDCVLPEHYVNTLKIHIPHTDAFGGPDSALPTFTPVQKAISYSMTSPLTTGGIRGGKASLEKFHPRSFNMGFSRKVFETTGGFSSMRFGEDVDLSIRIFDHGFRAILIPDCFVYHKRRTDFKKFFKQVYNSGIARINLFKRHPKSLKLVHFLPAAFVVYQVLSIPHAIYHHDFRVLWPTIIYLFAILVHASVATSGIKLGLLSMTAAVVQLTGYGSGFIVGFIRRIMLRQPEFHAWDKTFYK
ncbi:MAG: glycosyltransferase [Cyclobacteriaceae bacterium]|nr:glycosyltransferase [Cyclobacteriaceae bacterium]